VDLRFKVSIDRIIITLIIQHLLSSSIVEGANVQIKQGTHAAKPSMNIDMAGNQMLKQVELHEHKRNTEAALGIRRFKHWSASYTKEVLTSYMEGLAVKNFDGRDRYYCVRVSTTSWLVVSKIAIDSFRSDSEPAVNRAYTLVPEYLRVRKVQIDMEGFMTCTCSYCYHYLVPCRHMMVVLDKSENVKPNLFHIRWWEVFNYYYLSEYGKQAVPDLHGAIDDHFRNSPNWLFTSDMVFKGCPTNFQLDRFPGNNVFHNNLDADLDDVTVLIKRLDVFNNKRQCIEVGSAKLAAFMKSGQLHEENTLDDASIHFDQNLDTNCITSAPEMSFGGLSETVGHLSPRRMIPRNIVLPECVHINASDTEDYHLFMFAKDAAKKDEQKVELRKMLLDLANKFLSDNRSESVSANETTFIGEDGSKDTRSGKRHKQMHEKWRK
jgi:hypothetical protein